MRAVPSDAAVLAAMRRLDAAAPGHGRSVGEIALLAGLEPASTRSALVRLALRGIVGKIMGGRYALGRSRHLAHRNGTP
jgi:DNA-binding IclR family transcriptional regulator